MNLPWNDLKVAYGVNNPERLWKAEQAGKTKFPAGWEFNETDGSGARFVAIFRVDVLPTVEDGRKVKAELRRWAR